MKRVFRTMQDARRALALDTGFDPFISGGWGRCTKQKLADAGYVVDPAEVRSRQEEADAWGRAGKCRECGDNAMTETFCEAHGIGNCGRCRPKKTGYCEAHTRWTHQCDNGHSWQATDAEAQASGYKCPKCGGYSV